MESKDEPSDDNEPCSDTGSSEKQRFEAATDTPVPVLSSPSSSVLEAGTNHDSIKETAGEDNAEANDDADADAEKTRNLSPAYSDILADMEANPKILESSDQGKKMITFLGSQDTTPLAFNPAALRQIDSTSESIEIMNQEPESLKERKQEAIKLGVELSYLVTEAMFLAADELLDKTEGEFRKFMKDANGPLDVKGIVIYNLTAVFHGLKGHVKARSTRPRIDLTHESSQTTKFFKLFSEAIARLEEVIRCIRNLSRTRILEEEPETLSAIDREVEDCKRELRKIDLAITEVKQFHFNTKHSLSSHEPKKYTVVTDAEEEFFGIWNSLFQSGRKRKASSSDSEDSVGQPSIQ